MHSCMVWKMMRVWFVHQLVDEIARKRLIQEVAVDL
jgi:hypothetical protein